MKSRSEIEPFHAGGLEDYVNGDHFLERLRFETEKLSRRLKSRCRPKNLVGRIKIIVIKRRLLNKVRSRLVPLQSLFLSERL